MKRQPFITSSIGVKFLMGLTGVILFLFLIGHMIGNLKIFTGPAHFNAYAQFLKNENWIQALWAVRAFLFLCLVVHVWAMLVTWLRSHKARPEGYRYGQRYEEANYASRTMRYTGPLIACFVIYHLLHFTVPSPAYEVPPADEGYAQNAYTIHQTVFEKSGGGVVPAGEIRTHPHVYNNVVAAFQNPWKAGIYILAVFFLGFHLWHGVWSFTQTFGWQHPRYDLLRQILAWLITLGIVGGFLLVPLGVLVGIVEPDGVRATLDIVPTH